MTHRYALRFEDGERRGEIVTLSGTTTTFGRRPGNGVQVLDPSVSGKHAELVLDDEGVLLRDLGSTNGTRVNGERVSERRLRAGDRVTFGNVDLALVDLSAPAAGPARSQSDVGLELEADEPAFQPAEAARAGGRSAGAAGESAAPNPAASDAGEAVRSIGAEKLARSGKRSVAAFATLALFAGGAAAAWWFMRDSESRGGGARAAVTPVPGNLLAVGFSFETGDLPAGWSQAESADAAFAPDSAAARTGTMGLSAEIAAGGHALLISEAFSASGGIALSAALGCDGPAEARAGLRFESSQAGFLPVEAWSAWSRPEATAAALELRASAPAAYDRARVLIAGRALDGTGTVAVDDVSAVPLGGQAPRSVRRDEHELVLMGEPQSQALLYKIDHPVISGLAFVAQGRELALKAQEEPTGMSATVSESGAVLRFSAEAATAAGGVATTGASGYRTHQAQFEREGVDSVLLGGGRDMVRLRFDPPATLRGRPDTGGGSFGFEALGVSKVVVQVSFNEERVEAQRLAVEARAADRAAQPGKVIEAWTKLIDRHPIDAALVEEAESGRAKALASGLARVATIREDVQRARFFRLLDLFRECRARAILTAELYAGSEVETGARAVAADVDADIVVLARDLDRVEAQRLARIHQALVATRQTRLAARVAAELAQRYAVQDPASLLDPNGGGDPRKGDQ